MLFYHGGKSLVHIIDLDQIGSDGELLCASASTNVALRYGPVVSIFELQPCQVRRTTLADWWANKESTQSLRDEGFAAVIVAGEPDSFDFPTDTLFILDPKAVAFIGKLTQAGLDRLDDIRCRRHTPRGQEDPDWTLFVNSIHAGDEQAALEEAQFQSESMPPPI